MKVLLFLHALFWLSSSTEAFSLSKPKPNIHVPQTHRASYRVSLTPSLHQSTRLFYGNDTMAEMDNSATLTSTSKPLDRFNRQASRKRDVDQSCILTLYGKRYNMTAWANSHPGGSKILLKFHDKNATKAFEAAHHSDEAYAMLQHFEVKEEEAVDAATVPDASPKTLSWRRRARKKLFTREDPIGFHKYLGIFCLLNFIGRYTQMYFGDPAAGLGTRGHPWFSMACLVPHALLSLSSLIFHTVPKERVSLIPTIWQEYRAHNIVFGVRSVLTAMIAALAIKANNTPMARTVAVAASGACVLLANWGADQATEKLRAVEVESTTATMPYWEGCSMKTQRRFKVFYAYCQFMATLACLACGNPAWPLAVLLAIQMASLLMTMVRKGLLSARGYHYGYTASLMVPYMVGLRSMLFTKSYEFPIMLVLAWGMYQLRRRGVSKYALWVPVILGRLLVGDKFINYAAW